LFAIQIDLNSR